MAIYLLNWFLSKRKNEYQGIYDLLKTFTYFTTKGSQRKILYANPAEDKIFQ